MLIRRALLLITIALLALLLVPSSALASVKCQCNNGSIVQDMGSDPDDDDLDEACNDACSMQGGGELWSTDDDDDDDDVDVVDRPGPRHPGNAARRR